MAQVTTEELIARYGEPYKWLVTLTVLVGLVAMIASSTMINVAMPDIMGEFGMGQDQAQWLSTAFTAAMTVAMLAATWAVKSFGTRRTYNIALIAFVLGSIVGAFSSNDVTLIIARTIQGAAAGLAQPLGMVVMFQVFPPNKRGTAMGLYGMGVILAPALGPTVGGMLIDSYSWHYVFFLGLPFCVVGFLMGSAFLPTTTADKRPDFDWLGIILLSIGIATFLAGMSNGQRMGWDSLFVRGAGIVSAVALLAFVVQERRTPHPLLNLAVYRNPRFVAASLVALILGIGLFGSTYLVPLFVQTVQGYTPTDSGLLLMPAGIVLGIIFPVAGRLSDRFPAYALIFIGMTLFAISNYLMSFVDMDIAFWTLAGYVILGRIGMGFIMPSLNNGSLRVLDPRLISDGAGAINFIRQLGGAVGVNLLSVYLERQTTTYAAAFNSMQSGTPTGVETLRHITAALDQAGLTEAAAANEAHRFLSNMISAQASVMGYRESFLFAAVLSFITLVPVWFMRAKKRSKK
ncbi:MAG: DHA2 family efflux MFS transporter permease subunit [Burkholderiales bacterium]|nr:DHA2 family efflux MFS transporter permease subunit [Burkholderiales bacterium]